MPSCCSHVAAAAQREGERVVCTADRKSWQGCCCAVVRSEGQKSSILTCKALPVNSTRAPRRTDSDAQLLQACSCLVSFWAAIAAAIAGALPQCYALLVIVKVLEILIGLPLCVPALYSL